MNNLATPTTPTASNVSTESRDESSESSSVDIEGALAASFDRNVSTIGFLNWGGVEMHTAGATRTHNRKMELDARVKIIVSLAVIVAVLGFLIVSIA